MNMDQQKDYEDSVQPTKQTLAYQLDSLFINFSKILLYLTNIQGNLNDSSHKLLVIKHLQLLTTVSKHSKFNIFYPQIPKTQRLNALTLLIVTNDICSRRQLRDTTQVLCCKWLQLLSKRYYYNNKKSHRIIHKVLIRYPQLIFIKFYKISIYILRSQLSNLLTKRQNREIVIKQEYL